jgi:hypothetical protein
MRTAPTHIGALRCFNHANREAAAKCLSCGRFYCRECVTEHGPRVLCASCLAAAHETGESRKRYFSFVLRAVQLIVAILIVWCAMNFLGRGLLWLPSEYHEQMIWRGEWLPEE